MAITTFELIVPIPAGIDMGGTAERTDNCVASPVFCNEVKAVPVAAEMLHEAKSVGVFKLHNL